MGMKQYSDVFQREKINGEVLVDMDDEMMKNDLGISAKLHRMRLLKVSRMLLLLNMHLLWIKDTFLSKKPQLTLEMRTHHY